MHQTCGLYRWAIARTVSVPHSDDDAVESRDDGAAPPSEVSFGDGELEAEVDEEFEAARKVRLRALSVNSGGTSLVIAKTDGQALVCALPADASTEASFTPVGGGFHSGPVRDSSFG